MAEHYEYTYSASQQKEIEAIRKKYLPKEDKMETLRKLDKKAEKPGCMASIVLGVTGTLLLGVGMCCCMVWGGVLFIPGIIIGILGMVLTGFAYPLYKKITAKKRAQYAEQILALTNELAVHE